MLFPEAEREPFYRMRGLGCPHEPRDLWYIVLEKNSVGDTKV
jgi:hypothetical protein